MVKSAGGEIFLPKQPILFHSTSQFVSILAAIVLHDNRDPLYGKVLISGKEAC